MITRPEKSYRQWCVVVCDLETSRMRKSWPAFGRSATHTHKKKRNINHLHVLAPRSHPQGVCPMTAMHTYGDGLEFLWSERLSMNGTTLPKHAAG